MNENFNRSKLIFFRYASAGPTPVGSPVGNANFNNIAHVPAKQYRHLNTHFLQSPTTFFDFQVGTFVSLPNRPPDDL